MKRPFQARTDTLVAAMHEHLRYVERAAKTAEQMSDAELMHHFIWNDGGAAEPYRLEFCRRNPPPSDYVPGTMTEEERGRYREELRRRHPKKESE